MTASGDLLPALFARNLLMDEFGSIWAIFDLAGVAFLEDEFLADFFFLLRELLHWK